MSPIPAALAPLAAAVVGDRPVGFRHGAVARRALAKVGKEAATVGGVVHLPVHPAAAPLHVVAHELVHAARPSPVPRFFDDAHHDVEERTAQVVGERVRRRTSTQAFAMPAVAGPASHVPSGAGALVAAVSEAGILRRHSGRSTMSFGTAGLTVNDRRAGPQVAAASSPSGDASATTAEAGATRRGPTLVPGGSFSPPPGFGATTIHRRASPEVISRFTTGGDMLRRAPSGNDSAGAVAPEPPASTGVELDDELFERLVTRLEARLRSDLERRGRWFGSELP